jgi:hypothetical protein
MTAVESLTGIFVHPRAVARSLAERPNWVLAFLAAAVILCITSYLTYPIVNREMAERVGDSFLNQFMTDEQLHQMQEDMRNPTTTKRLVSLGQITFGLLAFQIALTGFLAHILARLLGGNGRPRSVIALYAHARLIDPAAGELVKLPLVFATGSYLNVNLSLAALVPNLGVGNPVHDLLSIFSLFGMASLVVLVIGLEEIHGLPRDRAALAAGLPWLAGGLIRAIFTSASF